jgi:hypothetical protein
LNPKTTKNSQQENSSNIEPVHLGTLSPPYTLTLMTFILLEEYEFIQTKPAANE